MVAMNHPSSAKLALIKLANTGFLTENPARRRMANRPVRGGQLVQRYGHAGRNGGRATIARKDSANDQSVLIVVESV